MKTIKVNEKTVVICLNKSDAKTLQRGLASGYFQRNVAHQRICERLQDAIYEVEPPSGEKPKV